MGTVLTRAHQVRMGTCDRKDAELQIVAVVAQVIKQHGDILCLLCCTLYLSLRLEIEDLCQGGDCQGFYRLWRF